MKKKAYALFFALILLLGAACRSIARVSGSAEYVAAAAGQRLYRLDVARSRGAVYDKNIVRLVGGEEKRVAVIAPTIEAVGVVERATGGRFRERLAQALEDGKPFLLELDRKVKTEDLDHPCIDVFRVPERYSQHQLAPHVVGYLDSLGGGASGVELAMDDALERYAGGVSVTYQVDALGRVVAGGEKQVENTLEKTRGGVALTLDSDLQRLAEKAGSVLGKGAVVITEVPNCEIRALASFPSYSPLALGEAAESEDGALLNRAFCAYAPGSVFKLVPAAAQLEAGGGVESYDCVGAVNAGGMLFHCYGGKAHGKVDLLGALERSCNCYFINAARSLGGQGVLGMAYNLGLGTGEEFGRGLFSDPGSLPDAESLENVRALANFAFGQGEITVTPVQMCGMLNAVASGGVYSTPKLILGTVDASLELDPVQAVTERSLRVMSVSTAGTLQKAMEGAVREGTAQPGAPDNCTAGVKTGTAQTGVMEGGEELLHFWYCGYVRDERGPRYCITVLRESTPDDHGAAARVFRQVAEDLGERMQQEP